MIANKLLKKQMFYLHLLIYLTCLMRKAKFPIFKIVLACLIHYTNAHN